MSCLSPVDIDIIVSKDSTSHRRNSDGLFLDSHLFNHLGYQPVYDTMTASGAIMHCIVIQKR